MIDVQTIPGTTKGAVIYRKNKNKNKIIRIQVLFTLRHMTYGLGVNQDQGCQVQVQLVKAYVYLSSPCMSSLPIFAL